MAKSKTVPAGSENLLRRAIEEVNRTGKRVTVTGQDEQVLAVILPVPGQAADSDPATLLAAAEDERHTLLAQAARIHLSNLAAETRRYQDELSRIENSFGDRLRQVPEVPEWIAEARKDDIAAALRIVNAVSWNDTADLIVKAGLSMSPSGLRLALAEAASEPARVHRAWITARAFLKAVS